jgi:hypothetical protein
MSWVITPQQKVFPYSLGDAVGGGYFVGYISHAETGNATHALIVAPKEVGATGTGYTLSTLKAWKTTATATANTTSPFDGAANTAAMVTAGIANHPAAEFCTLLTIGGFSDWYLPARYELDIAYFNFKPSTASNSSSWGPNNYSVPKRSTAYTAGIPPQTVITPFQLGGAESFVDNLHFSSTEGADTGAWDLSFASGAQSNRLKTNALRVRAFRRIAL